MAEFLKLEFIKVSSLHVCIYSENTYSCKFLKKKNVNKKITNVTMCECEKGAA